MGEEKSVIPVKIKKYANRRLYNTATSAYITLDDLAEMIKLGQEFVVHDAKTNDDITRHVLTQIILEKESGSESLLPTAFLRGLIKFYDNKSHDALSNYLDVTMQAFMQNQSVIKDYMNSTFKGMYKLMDVHQIRKQNQDVFSQLMTFFGLPKKETPEVESLDLTQLKSEVDALQQKLAQISMMQKHKTT